MPSEYQNVHIISSHLSNWDWVKENYYTSFNYMIAECDKHIPKATLETVDTHLNDDHVCERCKEYHIYGTPGRLPYFVRERE